MFVKYKLRLKKHFSMEHIIIQHSVTRQQYTVWFALTIKITTDERSRGLARE